MQLIQVALELKKLISTLIKRQFLLHHFFFAKIDPKNDRLKLAIYVDFAKIYDFFFFESC